MADLDRITFSFVTSF